MEYLFSAVNIFALFGWMCMIITPRWKHTSFIVFNIISISLSLCYLMLIVIKFDYLNLNLAPSFRKIKEPVLDSYILLAGWIHYLAFDLIAGIIITEHALKCGKIKDGFLMLCQFLILTFGPAGFLLYYSYYALKTKNIKPDILNINS